MAVPGDLVKSGIATNEKLTAGAEPLTSSGLANSLPVEVRAQIARSAAKADEILIRLQRLFISTANVESFLAPLQYSACLISYLQKDVHLRSASTAAALNDVVGSWRNTLRLPADSSAVHTSTAAAFPDNLLLQENVAHLIELGILSSSSLPIPLYRDQTKLWLHSNRFWLLGISCDLLRLAREAMLRRTSSASKIADSKLLAEQEKVDKKWWNELVAAGCTWPLCLHWSFENGLSKFNDGVIGVLGVFASYETLRQRWEETKSG